MHREITNVLEIDLIRLMNLRFKLINVSRKKGPVLQTLTTINCNGYESTSSIGVVVERPDSQVRHAGVNS